MNHWQLRDAGGDSDPPESAAVEWSTTSSNGLPDNYGVLVPGRASAAAAGVQQAAETVGLISGLPTSLSYAHNQGAAGRWYSGDGGYHQYDEMGWYSGDVYIPAITCQVEGCGKDLMRAGINIKHYYKRHRICEVHAKASAILVDGAAQRFCQQCGRFQLISEFDEDKRSCRSRLADHNRRRRKSTGSAADQPTSSQNTGNSPADSHVSGKQQTSSSSMETSHYKR